jgi:sarcosine oxidase delta subunit
MLGIECPYCGTIYETEIHEIAPEEEFTEEQCPKR